MHIVFLIKDYKTGLIVNKDGMPSKSGAEIHAERQALELSKRGHQVSFLTRQRRWAMPLREQTDGGVIHRLPKGLRLALTTFFLMKNSNKIDILYVFGQTKFSMLAVYLGHLLNISAVYVSTMTGETFEKNQFRALFNQVLGKMAGFIAINDEISQELIANGYDAKIIHLIPQGVDTTHFHPVSQGEKAQLQASFGIPEGKVVVLFCSRLDKRKGFDILLEQWAQVAVKIPELHLLIVGGGRYQDEEKLAKYIDNRTTKDITYVGEVADTSPYMQCADIFFFPSRREGLPNVLMESMACGCAPVCSDIAGCRDIIQNGKNGLLFSLERAEDVVTLIAELCDDRDLLARISEEAVRYSCDKLDIKVAVDQVVDVFINCKRKTREGQ